MRGDRLIAAAATVMVLLERVGLPMRRLPTRPGPSNA